MFLNVLYWFGIASAHSSATPILPFLSFLPILSCLPHVFMSHDNRQPRCVCVCVCVCVCAPSQLQRASATSSLTFPLLSLPGNYSPGKHIQLAAFLSLAFLFQSIAFSFSLFLIPVSDHWRWCLSLSLSLSHDTLNFFSLCQSFSPVNLPLKRLVINLTCSWLLSPQLSVSSPSQFHLLYPEALAKVHLKSELTLSAVSEEETTVLNLCQTRLCAVGRDFYLSKHVNLPFLSRNATSYCKRLGAGRCK